MLSNETEQKESDRLFYAGVLKGEECQCGRYKQPGYALCFRCYRELPGDLKRALYRRMGEGFEAAYDEAVSYLTD